MLAADFRAVGIEDRGALGSAFVLEQGGKRIGVELALAGRHVISNALAALAAPTPAEGLSLSRSGNRISNRAPMRPLHYRLMCTAGDVSDGNGSSHAPGRSDRSKNPGASDLLPAF